MNYQVFQPPPDLSKFVRFFWVLENSENSEPFIHRSIADGSAELIFHYHGQFHELKNNTKIAQSYSMLHAQSQFSRRFETEDKFGIFGAYLYPYALPLLFSFSSSSLSNEMPDIQVLLGKEGRVLEEKVILAKTNIQRVAILSQYLRKKLLKNNKDSMPPISTAISYLIHSKPSITVESLADKFCLSERQFERKFKEYAGFTPKLYLRILRFGSAINYYGSKNKSLTEIAFECGYYDQSHFIHEFKEFSGYHPREYFHGKPEGSDYRSI